MTAEERLKKLYALTLQRSSAVGNNNLQRTAVWSILEPEYIDLIADLVVERIKDAIKGGAVELLIKEEL